MLYETPYENEEKREEYPGFRYLDVVPVETAFTLTDRADIQALFRMTPYFWKTPPNQAERLADLERLDVTAQFRVHVMERIPHKIPPREASPLSAAAPQGWKTRM